jgi:hypothetical protein
MQTTKAPSKNRIAETNGKHTAASLFSIDKLRIKVVGVTPLLCANPSSMQPESDAPTRSKKAEDKAPEAVCRKAAYFDADGNCAFPNVALFSAILTAAELMKLKIGSGRMAPAAATFIRAGLTFDWQTRLTTLVHPKTGKPLTEKDYEIDMQRAVNQNTGGAIVAIRPRFDEWSATFDLLVDTSNSDLMGVIQNYFDDILKYAGFSVGMGAFRAYIKPKGKGAKQSAGGPYGKFSATIID